MITTKRDDSGLTLTMSAQVDLISAEAARVALMATTTGTETPVRLELSEGPATVPALQLMLAARRSLQAVDRFAGFGPNADAHLGSATGSASSPRFASVRTAA